MTTNEPKKHSWDIPEHNVEMFAARVDTANRRLERAGSSARFDFSYTPFTKALTNAVGSTVHENWVRAEMTGPLSITLGDFTFVAALVPEEGGMTVHTAPGQELGGYAPHGDTRCEHCTVNRVRTRLYLVRDDRDNSILQLGHTCIELYTGMSPVGLWALTFDENLDELARGLGSGGAPREALTVGVDDVLARAWVISDSGRKYVPATSEDATPTISVVRDSMFGRAAMSDEDRRYFAEVAHAAADVPQETLDAIKASVGTVSQDSDYGRNLRVILDGDLVSTRNIGVLASLVTVYARQRSRAVSSSRTPSTGFLGEVGERLRDVSFTVSVVRHMESAYGSGVSTFLVGRTADDHDVLWRASSEIDVEPGDRVVLSAATVKKHDSYRGNDQTVLTRCSLAKV